MKSKLLIFIIIFTVLLSLFGTPALASTKVVDISRPEGNEIVTKDVFSLCGSSINDEATIELFYKDRETGKYTTLLTTEGEASFTVGKLFGKDFVLKYKGENQIKLKAYTSATKSDPQIEEYTITLAEEKKDDNWLGKVWNWFTGKDTEKK